MEHRRRLKNEVEENVADLDIFLLDGRHGTRYEHGHVQEITVFLVDAQDVNPLIERNARLGTFENAVASRLLGDGFIVQ